MRIIVLMLIMNARISRLIDLHLTCMETKQLPNLLCWVETEHKNWWSDWLMIFVSTIIKSLYHDGLLNQSVAVFTHVLQDLVRSIVAGCGGGLGGHSQRVDQSLGGEQSNSHSSWQSCLRLSWQTMGSWPRLILWNVTQTYLRMIASDVR